MKIDTNKISYRKATNLDIQLIVDYRIIFLTELQGRQTKEKESDLRKVLTEYFIKSINNNSYIGWIAEIDDKPIGFGGMVIQEIPGNFSLMNGLEGYILNMYTVPEYRKNGICKSLLKILIDEGKKLGLNKAYLHASNDGIDIYRKKGFSEPELPVLEKNFK